MRDFVTAGPIQYSVRYDVRGGSCSELGRRRGAAGRAQRRSRDGSRDDAGRLVNYSTSIAKQRLEVLALAQAIDVP